MYSHKFTAKAANTEPHPPLRSKRLLDQMRERLRYMHYSLNTEKTYLYWVRWFIRFSGLRHPREMGRPEVEAFLTMLANERRAAPSTHRQALSAILYLYKEVLSQELPWLQEIGRPVPTKRIPSVLTRNEVGSVLSLMEGVPGLLARLLYGTGMRHMEGLSLRVKDVDLIELPNVGASIFHMRLNPNTHVQGKLGLGIGCLRRPHWLSTRGRA